MTAPIELPMAIAGCGLDQAALQEQLGRYRRLGAGATVTRSSALELTARFDIEPDRDLMRATLAVERECCSFFALEYAESERRLTVSVADPERAPALDALAAALQPQARRLQGEAMEPSRPHTGQDS
jgi:hypothetical protein